MTPGSPLTIVQLTDCHLFTDPEGSLRETVTRPRLRTVLEEIHERVPLFDLLVVTGDTAHDEAPETYKEFRSELGDWVDRLRVVPGNHDDRESLRRVLPGGCDDVTDRLVFRVETTEWLVLGLDSQQPGEDAGDLGTAQLTWLAGQLETARTRNAVLFLHHPPIGVGSPWVDRIGLRDARALETVLAEHPHVCAVFSGHVHQEASGRCGGAEVRTSPAVGPQFRPHTETLVIDPGPPAYRIIELHPAGEWSTTVVRCAAV